MRYIFIAALMLHIAAGPLLAKKPAAAAWADMFNQPRSLKIQKPVRAFVMDAQACAHFSGEEGYEKERQQEIDNMVKKTCPNLKARKQKLLKRYGATPESKAIILEVWQAFE